ncbi:MAG: hypothetical protein KAI66_06885 [Lentisphaeria bacterium]|nr:hypothetical protein [Lentisphaeria bacterium]
MTGGDRERQVVVVVESDAVQHHAVSIAVRAAAPEAHVFSSRPEDPLPESTGMVVLTLPVAECESILRHALRQRIPLLFSAAPAADAGALDRLAIALKKRRTPNAVLGSLRFVPWAAKLSEVLTSGALGQTERFTLQRPVGPTTKWEVWSDADLFGWLGFLPDALIVQDSGQTCVRWQTNSVTAEWAKSNLPAQVAWEIVVEGTAGKLVARVAPDAGAVLQVQLANTSRDLHIPPPRTKGVELEFLLACWLGGLPWRVSPSVAECAHAMRLAEMTKYSKTE